MVRSPRAQASRNASRHLATAPQRIRCPLDMRPLASPLRTTPTSPSSSGVLPRALAPQPIRHGFAARSFHEVQHRTRDRSATGATLPLGVLRLGVLEYPLREVDGARVDVRPTAQLLGREPGSGVREHALCES